MAHLAQEEVGHYLWLVLFRVAEAHLFLVEAERYLWQVEAVDPFLVLEVHSIKLMVTIFPLLSLESLFVLPMLPSQELNHLFKFQC